MSRFIGESLNERQIAALQAVANAAGGAQFASVESVLDIPNNHRDCRAIEGIELDELNVLLDELAAEDPDTLGVTTFHSFQKEESDD